MKTFVKKPKLAKFFRELKPTPVSYNKKVNCFLAHVCNDKFAVFWFLCCGINCKSVLFPTIDLYCHQLAQIVEKYIIDSFPRAQSRWRQKFNVLCVSTSKNGAFGGFLLFSPGFCSHLVFSTTVFRTTVFRTTVVDMCPL